MPDHTPKPSVTMRSDPRRPASESSTLLAATYEVWPAGSEHGARRRHEHEQVGTASFEFVGEHERGAGLGFGDEPEVVR